MSFPPEGLQKAHVPFVGSTAASNATSRVNAYPNENTEEKFSEGLNPV